MITMLKHFVNCLLSLPSYLTNHNHTYTSYHNQQAGSASSNFITGLITVLLASVIVHGTIGQPQWADDDHNLKQKTEPWSKIVPGPIPDFAWPTGHFQREGLQLLCKPFAMFDMPSQKPKSGKLAPPGIYNSSILSPCSKKYNWSYKSSQNANMVGPTTDLVLGFLDKYISLY